MSRFTFTIALLMACCAPATAAVTLAGGMSRRESEASAVLPHDDETGAKLTCRKVSDVLRICLMPSEITDGLDRSQRRVRPDPNGVRAAAGLRQHVLHDNGWSRHGNRSPECPDHS